MDPAEDEGSHPLRHGRGGSQLAVPGLDAEEESKPEEGRRRSPRLGAGGRRIPDREGPLPARVAREHLGEPVVGEPGRLEHGLRDAVGLLPKAIPGEPGGDERVVVGPDSADVVADRAVAGVLRGHRPHPPSREHPLGE